ncbi:pyruvate formate lyase activating enzyme [Breznakia sp. PF5-3]|uniref:glycyl-radical enzyme activating protein n=1 Tax=unclassified Breznakia TaxID=2623764 RepID=UPI002407479C|nr:MULTISPECIES: glycyl-radical enzyme activating protein [unclassified Breznakia]MDF9825596.1 pyruvate formate lyase activating enzyme [Breznakia sp. PM6-1]MDF9835851.1 pyruvate formate lyase activating enzyme [Breznakia sp. PF5-3]MDF9837596.1 pyruvate formate lyase activating enzyme [Breznakia sp. PFB2-8]MDF9860023.1 pyruvate formate lyase activating enzyme [Breznakia sp. PH5-24]
MINVFNIERFATHDGPGIRTVVFLKGCPLHCPWCANPESQDPNPILLYDKKKCIKCRTCEYSCPSKAITFVDDEFHYDDSKCKNLQVCVDNCPTGALEISGKAMSYADVVEEVMKDIDYYEASDGGVTISGGEPFTQFKSLLALVKEFKHKNLHVAIETCGNFSNSYIEEIDPYIDLYLFDLKHIDKNMYREICGGDLSIVFKNLETIDPRKVILRVPVITEFNYDPKTLEAILKYAQTIGIKKVNFLPYHLLGKSKYERMIKPYPWNENTLNKEDLFPYIDIAKAYDIELKVGG